MEWKTIETKWSDQEFQDSLSYLETSSYVRLGNAVLFRGKHVRISKEYIEFTAPELRLDLGHNHLIQSHLVKLFMDEARLRT